MERAGHGEIGLSATGIASAQCRSGTAGDGVRRGPPGDGATDRALVREARRGSRDAAAALFSRHWPAAWRAAFAVTGRRALADDVAQDAFERAFAAIDRFDERRPFAAWLHRIVVNRAIDLVRAERRLVGLDMAGGLEAAAADDAGDGAALRALACLSPERRAVVVLRHLLGYTPPEIAVILGLRVGTVNSRLGRAMTELRAQLEQAGD